MKRIIRRGWGLFLFMLVPALAAASPLLVYPTMTRSFGVEGFAAVAIGQSIGGAVAIVCELGWSVVGPQSIARGGITERSQLHTYALGTKVTALSVGLPLGALAAWILSPDFSLVAAAVAASAATSALSPMWLLVGMNRPGLILAAEAIPRLALNSAAALAFIAGAPLLIYAAVNILAVSISLAVVRGATGVRIGPSLSRPSGPNDTLRTHLPLTVGRSVSVTYTSLTTALVGAVNPGAVALFAASDRLMRMGLGVLAGGPNRLQSWIGAAESGDRKRRSRVSLALNLGLGVIAGLAFGLGAPFASQIVFAGEIPISPELAWIAAAVVLAICTSRGLGLSLVAEQKVGSIAAANIVAAVTGVSALVLLTPQYGAGGAMVSVLLAEIAGIIVQAALLFLRDGAPPRDLRA